MSQKTPKRCRQESSHGPPLEMDVDGTESSSIVCARVGTRPQDFRKWTLDHVSTFFREEGLGDIAQKFKDEAITGNVLHLITEERMEKMGISLMGQRLTVLELLDKLKNDVPAVAPIRYPTQHEGKVFNDPIHGHIELHPLCVRIIDTPQFQRLRYIKQLGGCYFVYPGASHNRFEHSLGVAHLAGRLVREIRRKQPELDITDEDILCVEIAGLCHDLGHGPYSYVFDELFIPKVRPESNWKDRNASAQMFDHLVEDNGLAQAFEKYQLTENDMDFIREQIAEPEPRDKDLKNWPYQGRLGCKSFLYEVIANQRNGIDVDKWDYLARDCHHLGITNNFDHSRFIKFARVLEVDEEYQIATRDKEVSTVYDMFHTRSMLYKHAFQHKTTHIVEIMLAEALQLADPYLLFQGRNRMMRMSEAIDDMVAYSKLTDRIIEDIYYSDKPELAPAREIIRRVYQRDLYKCVGQVKPKPGQQFFNKKYIPSLTQEICEAVDGQPSLDPQDMRLTITDFDYGMGERNPVDSVCFYLKSKPTVAIWVTSEQVSQMLPQTFRDQELRLYSCKRDKSSMSAAMYHFIKWYEKRELVPPVRYERRYMYT